MPDQENAKRPFRSANAPKTLVTVSDASHTGFTGLLAGVPGTPHPDEIGCAFIPGIVKGDPDTTVNAFAGLAGKKTGVSLAKRCPLPCAGTIPERAMPPAQQQDLTKIAGIAFFEGALRGDVGARCFLRETFAEEQEATRVRTR